MKTLATLTILLILMHTSLVQAANKPTLADSATHKLTVVIGQIMKRSGKLYIGLANNESSFKGESIKSQSVDVPASGEISVTFDGLAPGRYAVRVFQDLNNNQKMDFSGQMPDEPFSFSNVTMLMGPPNFDQSSFELNESKTISIRMMEM